LQNGKVYLSKALDILSTVAIVVLLTAGVLNITYAAVKNNDEKYNYVKVTIHGNNGVGNDKEKYKVQGNLFGRNLWYPGYVENGKIEIVNKAGKEIDIDNIGVKVTLADPKNNDAIYKSFAENMIFSIDNSQYYFLKESLISNKSISELLYKDGSIKYNGYELNDNNKVKLKDDNSIELDYSLAMDIKAGNELMNVTADIEVTIDFEESGYKHKNEEKHEYRHVE
jgi:hypothetical protein